MPQERETDSTSITLADFAADVFGDFEADGDVPESAAPADAAGAPPATPPADTPAAVAVPEGTTPPAELAGKPADAAATAPDVPPVPALDPLADAKPATYTVDGIERTYDKIRVLGEDGAIIDAADLPDLMRRLGERDHLYEQSQQSYQRVQGLEKLNTWISKDAEGKDQTFTGERGAYEMRLAVVSTAVENAAFRRLLSDPDKLIEMLVPDENGKFRFNERDLNYFNTQLELEQRKATDDARGQLQALMRPAPAEAAAPNYEAIGPDIIKGAAAAANADHAALTPADHKLLVQQLPRYIRTVTEQDRRQGEQRAIGSPIVDRSFVDLVKYTAANRLEANAAKAEATKLATTTTTAAATNAARLAAAARTPAAAVPSGRAPAAPAREPAVNPSDAKWDFMEKMAR